MKRKELSTKDSYLSIWDEINSTYQQWGLDLVPLFEGIKQKYPKAAQAIKGICHNFEPESYMEVVMLTFDSPTKVYQKIANLIPESDSIYAKLKVKSLKEDKYKKYEMSMETELHRLDYIFAIFCMAEDFVIKQLNNENVKFSKNALSVQTENIIYLVLRDEIDNITKVQITIPRRIEISFDSSEQPIE